MRIARKITFSLELAIVALVGAYAAFEIADASRTIRSDLQSDLATVATETSRFVANLPPATAHELLDRFAKADPPEQPRVRWIEPGNDGPAGSNGGLGTPRDGEIHSDEHDDRMFVTRGFIDSRGRPGWIEVSQSTTHVDDATRRAGAITIALVALIIVVGTVYSLTIGERVIARPLHRLVERFRRVGAGDLTPPADTANDRTPRRDEIGELERELAQMIANLAEARERAISEHAERVTAIDQLRHADRLTTVGKLASGMAHELGTPLNVIAGYAKLIATEQETGEGAVDSARIIGEQTAKVTALVRQLLDFARRGELRLVTADLRETVGRAIQMVGVVANKASIRIVQRAPDEPLPVRLDDAKLQQVVVNLAINALHASRAGDTIEVAMSRDGDSARLDVIDRGAGITVADRERVFEPFFTTKPVGEGTGLGLAVSHGIVDDHHGRITVASEPGRGTTFSVFLPMIDPRESPPT